MTPQIASQLAQSLNAQAPPSNPATPDIRKSPQEVVMLDLQRVRMSLKRALDSEIDPNMTRIFSSFISAIEQRMQGMDTTKMLQFLQSALGGAGSAQMGPPSGVPGMAAGLPAQGTGMPAPPPGGMGMPPAGPPGLGISSPAG